MYCKFFCIFFIFISGCNCLNDKKANCKYIFEIGYVSKIITELKHTSDHKKIASILAILELVPGEKKIYSLIRSKVNFDAKDINLSLLFSFISCLAFEKDNASFNFLKKLSKNHNYYGYSVRSNVHRVIYLREYQKGVYQKNLYGLGQIKLNVNPPVIGIKKLILEELLSSRYPYISSSKKFYIKEKNKIYILASNIWTKKNEMRGSFNFIDFDSCCFSKDKKYVYIRGLQTGGIIRKMTYVLQDFQKTWKVIQIIK
ncbi:hypothetical protein [Candidatus Uabimicrobium sp. HlEnr_7]|uniref:hypothetical protein n=1 Tax=Candidatus Uabimicrobium helgolandensis TaxID=3095367 RepID=UPI003555EDDF